jgi:hypothetical protein
MRTAQEEIRPILKNRKNPSTIRPMRTWKQISDLADPIFRISTAFRCPTEHPIARWQITIASLVACRTPAGILEDYQADVPADNRGPKAPKQDHDARLRFGPELWPSLSQASHFRHQTTDDDGRAAGNGGPINAEQLAVLNGLADAVKADKIAFCKYLKVDSLKDLAADDYNDAIHVLKQKDQAAARQYLTGGK